jgi:hypothetical protein
LRQGNNSYFGFGLETGLQDGLFSNQNFKFGLILEGLAMKDVGIFYGHLSILRSFCYILYKFGIVRGNLEYFFPFWYFIPTKKNLANLFGDSSLCL